MDKVSSGEIKGLRYSEEHFQGYWVQLQSKIRRHDAADDLLEGFLGNPLEDLANAFDEFNSEAAIAAADEDDPEFKLYKIGLCIRTLYEQYEIGDPPGTFPPSLDDFKRDPLQHIKDFSVATQHGKRGGLDPNGVADRASRLWVKTAYRDLGKYRKACKFIWEVALATLSTQQSTTIIAGLPYGAGPALLKQIESQRKRQTTMALFTLFTQLIGLQLKPKENLVTLYARAQGIRARLRDWDPPIILPDQLIIVCLLRQLPGLYHGTRTIIMSTPNVTLKSCKEMLLDVENGDAVRIAKELGSQTARAEASHATGTGLVAQPAGDRKKKKKKPEKSAKYKSEGPCSVHGSRCSHASSECFVLHPELKKKGATGAAAVAESTTSATAVPTANHVEEAGPYGFMNETMGYCLMMATEEKCEEKTEGEDLPVAHATAVPMTSELPEASSEVPTAIAMPLPTSRRKRYYAVARGWKTGIFHTDKCAREAYEGYSSPIYKGFKTLSEARNFLLMNKDPTAKHASAVATKVQTKDKRAGAKTKTSKPKNAKPKVDVDLTKPPKKLPRRPRNHKWTMKGTKETRRKSRKEPLVNSNQATYVHTKAGSLYDNAENPSKVRKLGRNAGVLEFVSACMNMTSSDETTDEGWRAKEKAAEEAEDESRSNTPSPTLPVRFSGKHNTMKVKTKREFAQGKATTMHHPKTVSKFAVSKKRKIKAVRRKKKAGGVKLELTFKGTPGQLETLRSLEDGSKLVFELSTVVPPKDGAAVLATENVSNDPYNFMSECNEDVADGERFDSTRNGHALVAITNENESSDADEEEDDSDPDQWYKRTSDKPWHELSSDDDEPPALVPIDDSSTSEDKSTSESDKPPSLVDVTTTEEEDSSDDEVSRATARAILEALDRDEVENVEESCTSSDNSVPGLLTASSSDSETTFSASSSTDSTSSSSDDEEIEDYPVLHDDSSDEDPPGLTNETTATEREGEAYVTSVETSDSTVLDSGATEHCATHVPGRLKQASIGGIYGLSGPPAQVKGMGTINKVNNVMSIPSIKRNLLSVGRLVDALGGKITFTKKTAYVNANGRSKVLASRAPSGLYIVTHKDYMLGGSKANGQVFATTSITTDLARERVIALHRAFGHASLSTLRAILKNRKFDGISVEHLKLLPPCDACMLGKAHRSAKGRKSEHKAVGFGFRLCADCTGPFRTRSVGGSYYLLVVIDEYSAWTWVAPMATLKQVPPRLTEIIEVDLHQRDDHAIKYFRSDGGGEFVNKHVNQLLHKHGIIRETTNRNSSFQNGKAERRIRTLFERVRTVLSDAGRNVSVGFWADAAAYAAYTLNRTPSADGQSPFELRYGKKPKISHMRPFGNPCVVYRPRNVAGKIEDAGVKGVVIGYGYVNSKKGYRVRLERSNNVVTTCDLGFSAFPANATEVDIMPSGEAVKTDEQNPVNPAVITTPSNAREIDAAMNNPVATVTSAGPREQDVVPVITTPSNAAEIEADLATPRTTTTHTYLVGAKVVANWRGHGTYYPAIVTAVYPAGTGGSRTTYDVVYEADGEAEPRVGRGDIKPRSSATCATTVSRARPNPCGHALVTDCSPAYLADVPDLAREHITPKSYGKATAGVDARHWIKAMQSELKSLKDQNVYVFTTKLPDGAVVLNCLWVYKVKCGAEGQVTRYKARLTVNGKTQRHGIDYTKTFSPVAFATSIRLLFAVGLQKHFCFRQFDIKCAFLYADLPADQQVYMRAPPGFHKKGYWHLRKSLYGLRQAPMLFNEHLDDSLRKLGFKACTFDPCLYHHADSGAYLVIVVDDMVLASPTKEFADKLYKDLQQTYDIKDLGVPTYVIGVRVTHSGSSLTFTQDRYIADLHALHKPGDTPVATPATPSVTLCLSGHHNNEPSLPLKDPTKYRSLVGGLMYTLITRPDVAAAVSMCARYVQAPKVVHLVAAQRILRYLYHTRNMPLTYNIAENLSVTCFVDSSWAGDVDTRRSRYGFAVYVGKSLVAWCSKLHPSVALSSAEAEYTAATEACKTVKWVGSLMTFMQVPPPTPIWVFEDNSACRSMVLSAQVSGRNKHFELRQHYVRQLVQEGLITLKEISTTKQIADVFTKSLGRPAFELFRSALLQGLPIEFITKTSTEGGS